MKTALRKVLRCLRLDVAVDHGIYLLWIAWRRLIWVDGKIADGYLRSHCVAKLHIGCGDHVLAGWLNGDVYPRRKKGILRLDAKMPFPFPEDTFGYIFSEHVIEHISYSEGMSMLGECFRILQPGGRLRLATPDMAAILGLYRHAGEEAAGRYVEWMTRSFLKNAPRADAVFVINHFMRSWGHAFIYDEAVLRQGLESAGFGGVVRQVIGESSDEELRGLENVGRYPSGFLAMETMVLEAVKPARSALGCP